MNKQNLIQKKTEEFISKDEMFTSVDISNAIKEDGEWISNRDVRDWLKSHFSSDHMFINYNRTSITVCNDRVAATLYHPAYKLAEDYEPRNQHALTPSEVDAIKKAKSAQPSKSTADIVQILSTSNSGTSTIGNQQAGIVRIIRSVERIKVPGAIIRKLGLSPGDSVDPSFIKSDTPIPTKLKVNKDYRVSIPREVINFQGPVKVILRNKTIVFEKA